MNAAFDMPTEMANLAERIVGPVAAKLAQRDLDAAIGQIRHVLEQLSTKGPSADVDFENMAVNILEPVRAKPSEANFTRIVDRLRGAMVGFVNVMRPKRSLMWSHLAFRKPEGVRHFTCNRMHNLSLMRSHGGVRQSELWRCLSCYGSVPSLIHDCTDGGCHRLK